VPGPRSPVASAQPASLGSFVGKWKQGRLATRSHRAAMVEGPPHGLTGFAKRRGRWKGPQSVLLRLSPDRPAGKWNGVRRPARIGVLDAQKGAARAVARGRVVVPGRRTMAGGARGNP
jgi:hypothetical protein